MTTESVSTAIERAGIFNYLSPEVEHSLYRNGKVLSRRDHDGTDTVREGVVLAPATVTVRDARQAPDGESCNLRQNGFELLDHRLFDEGLDFFDHEQVVRRYYPDCESAVKSATGADSVVAFDHNVRSALGKRNKTRIAGGQQVQGPARVVHGDYTLTSAPQRLRELARAPTGNDTLRMVLNEGEAALDPERVNALLGSSGRFAIINLWRNIVAEPVATYPLALCDAQSFGTADLVVFEIHYQDRIGENYFAKQAPGHQWHFYPGLTRDEALLIKQWDSAGPLACSGGVHGDDYDPAMPCTFSFHSSFEDPVDT